MISLTSKEAIPFVYLDSSSLLRCGNYEARMFTRQSFKKNPVKYTHVFQEMWKFSLEDSAYYKNIIKLIDSKRITKLITMETFNPCIQNDSENTIKLFGTAIVEGLTNSDDFNSESLKSLTLWGESISFKTYNSAALTIADAKCVVADPAFFLISVGLSLMDYVKSTVPLFILSSGKKIEIEGDNCIKCELSPKDFINHQIADC